MPAACATPSRRATPPPRASASPTRSPPTRRSGAPLPYSRYVAIGDSSTEGLDDPIDPREHPRRFRGWADRLAEQVAQARAPEPLLYANLAIRGRKTREVKEEQLAPALAMRPDLASVFCGTNDIIRRNFALERVVTDIREMQQAFRALGATVLTITMPDLSEVMPVARRVRPRLDAFNEAVRAVSRETGTIVVDLALHPFVGDPRFWSGDRLHANSEGHRRIAAAIAQALGLPGADGDWAIPLPPRPRPSAAERVVEELRWTREHFVPWVWRHARGRSSGDGITPKRPHLSPLPPIASPMRPPEPHPIYDATVTTLDGAPTTLDAYRGKVLLIVNTASQCGFTPQYAGLEELHRRYAPRGFAVLGFPCNQFGEQEPGDAEEIRRFCSLTYAVTFPLFGKVEVNGGATHPLWAHLKSRQPGLLGTEAIKWNFTKFLVGRDGTVLKRFAPTDEPSALAPEIERQLG